MPVVTESEKASLTIQFARMEGKVDQVISEHARRLDETSTALQGALTQANTNAMNVATNTANIAGIHRDLKNLETLHNQDVARLEAHSAGALGKVMSVVAPIISLGSLALAFIIYLTNS